MIIIKTLLYILFISIFSYVLPLCFTNITPNHTKPYLISTIIIILLLALLPKD